VRNVILGLLILSLVAIGGCTGARGPAGPTGPTGPTGTPGPGSRVVYTGTCTSSWQNVSVTSLRMANFPAVSAYISPGDGTWSEVGIIYDNASGSLVPVARIQEGWVTFINCNGWQYKVVIVI